MIVEVLSTENLLLLLHLLELLLCCFLLESDIVDRRVNSFLFIDIKIVGLLDLILIYL